ncbi:MAG: type II toxin-antitoxin system RelE/ParE family toxin [Euryarchaeota archaeon]|nr:type II toxin-antitoxin system RelE/ParE family toxin [Euryarchaeota archaeon]
MGAFRVILDPRAEREFRELPAHVRRRFLGVFSGLEKDPFRPRPGCDIRVMAGGTGGRAVRVGDYRGLYLVVDDEVRFMMFRHRKVAYR